MKQSGTFFKHSSKLLTLSQNHNLVWPTLIFISMFVCENIFPFRGKFSTPWKFYVLQRIQNIRLLRGSNSRSSGSIFLVACLIR